MVSEQHNEKKPAATSANDKSPEARIIEEAEAVLEDVADKVEAGAEESAEALRKEAAEWHDRYLRLHAEWDTYRRRTAEQRAEEKLRANEKLIEDLLPVLDDFERTVDYANEHGETGLLDGVKAVQTKLIDSLKKDGLEVIDPVGEPYDALEAQAVATVDDTNVCDETVKEVYQKGYKLGKKVLRPAMVTVSTGGPKRAAAEGEGAGAGAGAGGSAGAGVGDKAVSQGGASSAASAADATGAESNSESNSAVKG